MGGGRQADVYGRGCMDLCPRKHGNKTSHRGRNEKREKDNRRNHATHYHDFIKDVFSKESFDELPPRKPWDHMIELTPGSQPIDCKIYPLSSEGQKQLDEFLKENLESGRIRPSK